SARYAATGYVPRYWVSTTLFFLVYPLGPVALTIYATRKTPESEKVGGSKSGGGSQTPHSTSRPTSKGGQALSTAMTTVRDKIHPSSHAESAVVEPKRAESSQQD